MRIDVTPVPAPRMTKSDAWRKRPAVLRYFRYKDDLREAWGEIDLPSQLHLEFIMPMPASWSAKKKLAMNGAPHQQRPDIDNLQKAVQDSLAAEDSYIYSIRATKHWGNEGSVTIRDIQ